MNKSFTLIEILVVIVIVGILSAFIIVSMAGVSSRATIAKGQAFSNSIKNSLMMNLVSEWRLDDASGTTIQDQWGTNPGTWYGSGGGDYTSPSWRTSSECVSGGCLAFDGTDDYVDCGNPTSFYPSPNLTISFWLKPSLIKNEMVIGKFNGTSSVSSWTWGAWIYNTGRFAFGIGSGSTNNFNANVYEMTANNWYQAVISYNGSSSNIKFYVNGQYLPGKDIIITVIPRVTNNSYYVAGDLATAYFSGSIDDVRIYNAAVPVSQVQQNYYMGLNRLFLNNGLAFAEYQERILNLSDNKANN